MHDLQLSLSQPGNRRALTRTFPVILEDIHETLAFSFLFVCAVCAINRVYGHGFAGARFFPATLSTDDPFVADELSLPTVSTIRTPDDAGTREIDISVEIAKRITPQFGIEIAENLTLVNSHEEHSSNGFGNLELAGNISW